MRLLIELIAIYTFTVGVAAPFCLHLGTNGIGTFLSTPMKRVVIRTFVPVTLGVWIVLLWATAYSNILFTGKWLIGLGFLFVVAELSLYPPNNWDTFVNAKTALQIELLDIWLAFCTIVYFATMLVVCWILISI